MDMTRTAVAAKNSALKCSQVFLLCLTLPLSGCIDNSQKDLCTPAISKTAQEKADLLVKKFWIDFFGDRSGKILSEMYHLDSIMMCGSTAKAVYSPKDELGAVGSTLGYDIDLTTGKVTQYFLNE